MSVIVNFWVCCVFTFHWVVEIKEKVICCDDWKNCMNKNEIAKVQKIKNKLRRTIFPKT